MRLGLSEVVLILIVILAIIKPDKLKEYATSLGEALKTVRNEKEKVETELIDPLKKDIQDITEPVNEVVQPIKEATDLIKNGS